MTAAIAVPAAVFVQTPGYWMSEALRRPVHIVHYGRVRLVLALAEPLSYGVGHAQETDDQTSLQPTPSP